MATEQNTAVSTTVSATMILVDVDQKEAIRRGINTQTSKIRVPVDISLLDDAQRDFVARYLNTKDLSINNHPTMRCTDKAFFVTVGTHEDFVRAVDEFLAWEKQSAAEAEKEFDAEVEKTEAAVWAAIKEQNYNESTGHVTGRTSAGCQVHVNYRVLNPAIPCSSRKVEEKVAHVFDSQEWQDYLAAMDRRNEAAKAAANAELTVKIANAESERLNDAKARKSLVATWLKLDGKNDVDAEMVLAGLVDDKKMVSEIIDHIIDRSDLDEEWKNKTLKDVTREVYVECRDRIAFAVAKAKSMGLRFIAGNDISYWKNTHVQTEESVISATFGFRLLDSDDTVIAESGTADVKKIEIALETV